MKIRLDQLLVLHKLAPDLKQARAVIYAGAVFVNGKCSDKVGTTYDEQAEITVRENCRYVSRGGLKLEAALHTFAIKVTNAVCLDIGASTGGFTDCLLQHGAARVYAVDVAYGQFSWKLRQDPRAIVIERFNARNISNREVPEGIDIAVMDASFISLKTLIPPLLPLLHTSAEIIALIKPQFELPREMVGIGGVVKDGKYHQTAVQSITQFAEAMELDVGGVLDSPLLGPKGNKEFLLHLRHQR